MRKSFSQDKVSCRLLFYAFDRRSHSFRMCYTRAEGTSSIANALIRHIFSFCFTTFSPRRGIFLGFALYCRKSSHIWNTRQCTQCNQQTTVFDGVCTSSSDSQSRHALIHEKFLYNYYQFLPSHATSKINSYTQQNCSVEPQRWNSLTIIALSPPPHLLDQMLTKPYNDKLSWKWNPLQHWWKPLRWSRQFNKYNEEKPQDYMHDKDNTYSNCYLHEKTDTMHPNWM